MIKATNTPQPQFLFLWTVKERHKDLSLLSNPSSLEPIPFLGEVKHPGKDPMRPLEMKIPTRSITSFFLPLNKRKRKKFRRGKRGGNKKEKRTTDITTKKMSTCNIQMFNISKYILNSYEKRLLEKGLSFCPTYKANDFQLFLDFNYFTRKLTLQRFFAIQEQKKKINNSEPMKEQDTTTENPERKHKSLKYKSTFIR